MLKVPASGKIDLQKHRRGIASDTARNSHNLERHNMKKQSQQEQHSNTVRHNKQQQQQQGKNAATKKPKSKGGGEGEQQQEKQKEGETGEQASGDSDKQIQLAQPVQVVCSERDIREILQERISFLPGSSGVQIDPNTPVEEYAAALKYFCGLQENIGFIIGDFLVFGQATYGSKYAAAVEATGRTYATLSNWNSIAKAVPPSLRRPELTFSHHAEVAALPEAKMKRALDKAVENKWTKSDLRAYIQEEKRKDAERAAAKAAKAAGEAGAGEQQPGGPQGEQQTGQQQPGEGAAAQSEKPSEDAQLQYDKCIEHLDAAATYLRSAAFSEMPLTAGKAMINTIKPIVAVYENWIEKHG